MNEAAKTAFSLRCKYIFKQLTEGCQRSECDNPHCATATKKKMDANESAVQMLKLASNPKTKICLPLDTHSLILLNNIKKEPIDEEEEEESTLSIHSNNNNNYSPSQTSNTYPSVDHFDGLPLQTSSVESTNQENSKYSTEQNDGTSTNENDNSKKRRIESSNQSEMKKVKIENPVELIKKLHLQLTQGCGNNQCKKSHCASSEGQRHPNQSFLLAMELIKNSSNPEALIHLKSSNESNGEIEKNDDSASSKHNPSELESPIANNNNSLQNNSHISLVAEDRPIVIQQAGVSNNNNLEVKEREPSLLPQQPKEKIEEKRKVESVNAETQTDEVVEESNRMEIVAEEKQDKMEISNEEELRKNSSTFLAVENLPKVSEKVIQLYSNDEEYNQGIQDLSNDLVSSVFIVGQRLEATVQHEEDVSIVEQVQVLLNRKGDIIDPKCSCKNEVGTWCHHIIASLLFTLKYPEKVNRFSKVCESIETLSLHQTRKFLMNLVLMNSSNVAVLNNFILEKDNNVNSMEERLSQEFSNLNDVEEPFMDQKWIMDDLSKLMDHYINVFERVEDRWLKDLHRNKIIDEHDPFFYDDDYETEDREIEELSEQWKERMSFPIKFRVEGSLNPLHIEPSTKELVESLKEGQQKALEKVTQLHSEGHLNNAFLGLKYLTDFWLSSNQLKKLSFRSQIHEYKESIQSKIVQMWAEWMNSLPSNYDAEKRKELVNLMMKYASNEEVVKPFTKESLMERKWGFTVAAELCLYPLDGTESLKNVLERGEVVELQESKATSEWRIVDFLREGNLDWALNLARAVQFKGWSVSILLMKEKWNEAAEVALSNSFNTEKTLEFANSLFLGGCHWGSFLLLDKQFHVLLNQLKNPEEEIMKNKILLNELPNSCISVLKAMFDMVLISFPVSKNEENMMEDSSVEPLSSITLESLASASNGEDYERKKKLINHSIPKKFLSQFFLDLACHAFYQFDFVKGKQEAQSIIQLIQKLKGRNLVGRQIKMAIFANDSWDFGAFTAPHFDELASSCVGKNRHHIWRLLDSFAKKVGMRDHILTLFSKKKDIQVSLYFIIKIIKTAPLVQLDMVIPLIYKCDEEDLIASPNLVSLFFKCLSESDHLQPHHKYHIAKRLNEYGDLRNSISLSLSLFEAGNFQKLDEKEIMKRMLDSLFDKDFTNSELANRMPSTHSNEALASFQTKTKNSIIESLLSNPLGNSKMLHHLANLLKESGDFSSAIRVAFACLKADKSNTALGLWMLGIVAAVKPDKQEILVQTGLSRSDLIESIFELCLVDSSLLFKGAKIILENGDPELALSWAKASVNAPGEQDRDEICEVFCAVAQASGQSSSAANFAIAGFKAQPNLKNFQRVRMTSDNWTVSKMEMLQFLKNPPPELKLDQRVRVEIFLAENSTIEASNIINAAETEDKKLELLLGVVDSVRRGKLNSNVLNRLWYSYETALSGNTVNYSHYTTMWSAKSIRMMLLNALVKCEPHLGMTIIRTILDNLSMNLPSSTDYSFFIYWVETGRRIFLSAGNSEEWPEYFKKIMSSPAVKRKPVLVRMLTENKTLATPPQEQVPGKKAQLCSNALCKCPLMWYGNVEYLRCPKCGTENALRNTTEDKLKKEA
eukprot:TRINITY_DN5724_c0_g1_i7.p1 TRINITY_DN5724_c0_g1~~TRINITY_DN5724_c0_g1_i7.p1  ORF type:complete len:1618 (-),score=510.98 TRINITY_DN5724_c0_g1_i7:22-4875(-)